MNKYLDKSDLEEMKKWREQIDAQVLIHNALVDARGMWFQRKLAKYGLDETKHWTLDFMTGQISELKETK